MKTAKELISRLLAEQSKQSDAKDPQKPLKVSFAFRFPSIYLQVVSETFKDQSPETRQNSLAARIGWTDQEIEDTTFHGNLYLLLQAPEEEEQKSDSGEGWLQEVLIDAAGTNYQPTQSNAEELTPSVRVVHFYGFKGGQGRSTCLAFFGKALAEDGYRVLAVDVDLEAPSLPVLLGTKASNIENTLLGVSADCEIAPVRVTEEFGVLDLLACAPDEGGYELEAVSLVMRCSMDPGWAQRCAGKIKELLTQDRYDVLLIDHRTGLSPFCLPWMHSLPGPVLLFARLDHQSNGALSYLPALGRVCPENPGLVVSLSEPGQVPEILRESSRKKIDPLLDAMKRGADRARKSENAQLGGAEEWDKRFVIWPYDSTLRSGAGPDGRLPKLADVGQPLRDAVYEMRRLIGVHRSKRPLNQDSQEDERDFLLLPTLREILAPSSAIRYVIGRKGTGKTRIARKLSEQPHVCPLLVDDPPADALTDSDHSKLRGLEAGSSKVHLALANWSVDPQVFWWMLLACGLKHPAGSRDDLQNALDSAMERIDTLERARQEVDAVLQTTRDRVHKQIFLVDGLERTLKPDSNRKSVAALFQVLDECQREPRFASCFNVRLFLRPDQLPSNQLNLEGRLVGQVAYLRWDEDRLLNYLLFCIASEPFFAEQFKVIEKIREKATWALILRGELDVQFCDALLEEVFPTQVRVLGRLLKLDNFLRYAFVDSAASSTVRGSDGPAYRATHYPEVAARFVRLIAKPEEGISGGAVYPAKLADRVHPDRLALAYPQATLLYRRQLERETSTFIARSTNRIDAALGDELITGMRGITLPFDPNEVAMRLARKFSEPAIVDARLIMLLLQRFQAMGVFEEDRRVLDKWQAGLLVQAALGLKIG